MSPLVITILVVFVIAWLALFIWGKKWINLPQWARLSSMLVLAAGMFYVVWWMQNDAKKHEETFMGICFVDGVGHLPPDGVGTSPACENPSHPPWHKKTILVYWGLDKEFDVYRDSHEHAMKWWKDQLGWRSSRRRRTTVWQTSRSSMGSPTRARALCRRRYLSTLMAT